MHDKKFLDIAYSADFKQSLEQLSQNIYKHTKRPDGSKLDIPVCWTMAFLQLLDENDFKIVKDVKPTDNLLKFRSV